ncbi:hypothetical protein [Paenibacillus rigui]|uniref:hypothetical protein n=1 Tax=Paenibacillus rigui TaxID=554312 RepID=UPI001181407A|nr:hypothetical protein [Paenibacillus rigui]
MKKRTKLNKPAAILAGTTLLGFTLAGCGSDKQTTSKAGDAAKGAVLHDRQKHERSALHRRYP